MRVLVMLDWFVYYTAAIVNGLVREAEVVVVQRDHGYELGVEESRRAREIRRSLFDEHAEVMFIRGRQRSLRGVIDVLRVVAKLMKNPPDVIHVQDTSDWRLAAIAILLRRPWILTIHDVVPHLGAQERGNILQRRVRRRLRSGASAVIVHGRRQSELARRQEWFNPGQSVFVIPHGPLAHGRFHERACELPRSFTVLFFGRLERYKGLDVLVAAAKIARTALPDMQVIIAGSGSEADALIALIGGDSLFDVRCGFVRDDEIPGLFAECSVVVLPYLEASQSGVIPLAYMHGRAVIASDVGDIPDAVRDGVTGLLVPPGDVESLAAAMIRLGRDRTELESMATAAFRAVESGWLSTASVVSGHLQAYNAVVRSVR
jgi:glycosyltransferase involved in cell wall biosynthesis